MDQTGTNAMDVLVKLGPKLWTFCMVIGPRVKGSGRLSGLALLALRGPDSCSWALHSIHTW